MAQHLTPHTRAALAADCSPDWIANVASIIRRDGHAIRASAAAPHAIEIQNPHQPEVWQPLNLPTNVSAFTTAADRDAVLEQLWRGGK